MSVRGGRGARGAWVAGAFALLLLPALLPAAPAQTPGDAWWGPSDRTDPTEGWAVRVPLVVENPYDYPVSEHLVAVDIDWGALLVAAGWTNQTSGTGVIPRGFALDVDSIRVIEYQRGFSGPIRAHETEPTPHHFYTSPFEAARYVPFDASRNPSGTLLFAVKGMLQPAEKRFYYVYANPLEYGDIPAHPFKPEELAPLEAFMWGSRGTVHYGFEPEQLGQTHLVRVLATTPGRTTVTFYKNDVGQFVPIPSSASYPNPVSIQGGTSGTFFIPANTPYKIVADKPVVVASHGITDGGAGGDVAERFGFAPSRTGSFAGAVFDVYGFQRSANGLSSVTVIKSGPGVVTISSSTGDTTTLTSASPVGRINIRSGAWSTLTGSGGNFLVYIGSGYSASGDAPFQGHQVPALSGGPSGTTFYAPLLNDGGTYTLCPEANVTLRGVSLSQANLQVLPQGGDPATSPPATLTPAPTCTTMRVPSGIPNHVYEFFSITDPAAGPDARPEPFRMLLGSGERAKLENERATTGYYGGLNGVDFLVDGRTALFGVYNDTRLTITEERSAGGRTSFVETTLKLDRDRYQILNPDHADATGRYRIVATKPIVAVSAEPAKFQKLDPVKNVVNEFTHSYARYVPGLPQPLTTKLGALDFRGPLVELRSPETDARQIVRPTGPGTPISFRLDVLNLGRWMAGDALSDTITISCTTPTNWQIEGCEREVTLSTGAAERLNIVVTPDPEDVDARRTITVEARSKAGGAVATFKLGVYVEIRYGVGMWFDVENGRKTIDPPVGLNPGEAYTYNIVLKNTGSTRDSFALRLEDAREGWEQALTLDGRPVTQVDLDAGEAVTLHLRVVAPNAETAPQNIVALGAQSASSALAGDIVNTATRIRPKVDIELRLDPATRLAAPGETATFNVTVRNSGNDVFRILFLQDSILPTGWNATLAVDEINLNPNPNNDPALNFTLGVKVTPPPDARAGDLATLKLRAETDVGGAGGRLPGDEVSAVTVVRKVHNITTPPLLDARANPGESLIYVLPVFNAGNGQDVIELLPGAVSPAGWRVGLESETVHLDFNESDDLTLRLDVPAGTPAGLYNLTFTARLSRESLQNLSIPVEVVPLAKIGYGTLRPLETSPGRETRLELVARNEGNLAGEFTFAAQAPEGWNVTFSPERAELAVGAGIPVVAVLTPGRDAPDGAHTLSLGATLGDAPAGDNPMRVVLARPQVYLSQLDASGTPRPGELVLVSAQVGNRGAISADNVTVALVVDGEVVDRVVLSRIPVNQTQLATLSWVATHRADDVQVVIDPENEIVQPARDELAAAVAFGSRLLPVPGPAPALAILLIASTALALRRRWRA